MTRMGLRKKGKERRNFKGRKTRRKEGRKEVKKEEKEDIQGSKEGGQDRIGRKKG